MKDQCILEKDSYTLKTLKDGTVITVRDLQLEILEVMDEIHRICEKNKIPYALIAGSALGICNYKGFIPWDDDMDIAVKREDWTNFIDALNRDLDQEKFYFQCFENDSKFNVIMGPTMKIRKRGTYIEEVNYLLRNKCKSGNGVFVDVIIYDDMSESKWKDEWARTVIKLVMPFYLLLDNIGINPIPLKKFIRWYSKRYAEKNKGSRLTSQLISVPWEKFLKEPVFLKEDVYPFELYDFEGRKFYSYHNIEHVMHKWYGPNCLKRWENDHYVETLPIEKRKPKHVKDIQLKSETKE